MRFYAANESAFWGYPLCKILFEQIRRDTRIESLEIIQIMVEKPTCDLSGAKTKIVALEDVSDLKEFQHQNVWIKLRKHVRLFSKLVLIMLSRKRSIFYTTTVRTVAVATILKLLFRSPHVVCFHNFESIDFSAGPFADRIASRIVARLSNKLNIILVPEQNRLDYIATTFPKLKSKLVLLPNTTCSHSETKDVVRTADDPLVLLHVGSIGESTYAMQIIDAVVAMQGKVRLILVGLVSPRIQNHIRENAKDYVTENPQVPHSELNQFYRNCDVGLVLYRPDSLNTRLAAPNKLYEFWSHGIPVLGPTLPGLESQFTQPEMGILVDMESPSEIIKAIHALGLSSNDEKRKLKSLFDKQLSAEVLVNPLVDQLISDAESKF